MVLKPQILEKDGKKEFAIIPYDDFLKIQELLEDYEDISDLRAAKKSSQNDPGVPLKDVVAALKKNE